MARSGHLAALLRDGTVLVVGGNVTAMDAVPTERFDPIRTEWSVGPTTPQLYSPTLTVLGDGRVLLAGGIDGFGNVTRAARLYDPATNRWAKTGSLSIGRAGHTATLMEDGTVLVVGGGVGMEPTGMDSVERFDPIEGAWSAAAALGDGRVLHATVRLADGSVLSIGGVGAPNLASQSGADILASAERYDPADDRWEAVRPMSVGRLKHDAVVMDDGSVVVIDFRGRAERFDPEAGRWASLPDMRRERTDFAAVMLPDGTLFVTGGIGDDPTASTETLDLASDRWQAGASMREARRGHSATSLADGSVLVVGGTGEDPAAAERFVP